MESIHLALSKKQHAALRLGRKVRLNPSHFQGSGVQYTIHPETFERIHRRLKMHKGIDLALHPSEIQASMLGGSLTNKLKRAGKVLNFIGEKIYKPIAKEIAPVAKPIFSALTGLAVSKINNTADPTARYLNAAERGVDIFNELSHPQRDVWQGPVTDNPSPQKSMVQMAAVAALANAFSPAAPAADPVGTYTPAVHEGPTFRRGAGIHGYGAHFLHHKPGTFGGRGAAFHPLHAARISNAEHVNFMQQIPQIYKDAARLVSGGSLYL
jgi:hypothetical protein